MLLSQRVYILPNTSTYTFGLASLHNPLLKVGVRESITEQYILSLRVQLCMLVCGCVHVCVVCVYVCVQVCMLVYVCAWCVCVCVKILVGFCAFGSESLLVLIEL
jgi:hypothetical protein